MDVLSYLMGKQAGGGGGEAVLINKNISSNGTYNASSDSADGYKKVTVSVPNTYAAGDEGKVVSNGALVSQTSDTVTANDTYDTTLINSLTVDVPTGGDEPPIPSEYQMVEYIEGTGTGAVIDTGIYPSENISVWLTLMPLVATGDALFGTKGTLSGDKNSWRIFNYSNKLYADIGNGTPGAGRISPANEVFEVNVKRSLFIGNVFVIDMDVPRSCAAQNHIVFTESYPTTLFINGWDATHSANSKWYGVKIANGDDIVREFVPCYRKADNVVGMYDRVSDSFFVNTGSGGSFTAGPDIASTAEIIEILLGVSE